MAPTSPSGDVTVPPSTAIAPAPSKVRWTPSWTPVLWRVTTPALPRVQPHNRGVHGTGTVHRLSVVDAVGFGQRISGGQRMGPLTPSRFGPSAHRPAIAADHVPKNSATTLGEGKSDQPSAPPPPRHWACRHTDNWPSSWSPHSRRFQVRYRRGSSRLMSPLCRSDLCITRSGRGERESSDQDEQKNEKDPRE